MLRTINKHHLDDLDDMQELLHITHRFWRVRESGHLTWTWPYLNFEPTTTLQKTRTKDMQCKRTATGSRGKIPIYDKILPPTRCPASGQNYTRNITNFHQTMAQVLRKPQGIPSPCKRTMVTSAVQDYHTTADHSHRSQLPVTAI